MLPKLITYQIFLKGGGNFEVTLRSFSWANESNLIDKITWKNVPDLWPKLGYLDKDQIAAIMVIDEKDDDDEYIE